MTKQQRAQVVELLRCAWDRSEPIARVGQENDYECRVISTAIAARSTVSRLFYDADIREPDYYDHALEAAARVELGEWP